MELAAEVAVRDATGFERAALERVLERDPRDAAEPEAGLDRPLDRLGLAERERHPELGEEAAHRAVERLPRAGAALAHDPVRGQQILVGEDALSRQGMARAAKDDQLVVAPGRGLEVGMIDLALDEADVELEVRDLACDLLGVGDLQGEPDRRMRAHEAGHQRHGHVVADRQGRADANAVLDGPALEAAFEIAGDLQDRLGAGPQRRAAGREAQPLADAVEQLQVELPLEVGEGAAGGRLRQPQLLARPADAPGAGDGQEHLELAEGVAHIGSTE